MNLANLKMTAIVNAYSFFKIPLLAFASPKVIDMTEARSEVRIKLGMRTKNHLGVMYFGALAMGAELSIALKAIDLINSSDKKMSFIFKDFSADFLKRADGHVHFVCDQAVKVAALVAKAEASSERQNETFDGYAYVPSNSNEPVMTYRLTLSIKRSGHS